MLHPYQCLAQCGNFLLAASSSRIDSFNLNDGSYVSSWTCPTLPISDTVPTIDISGSQPSTPRPSSPPFSDSTSEPPAKKRRLSDPAEKAEPADTSIKTPRQHRDKPQQIGGGTGTYPPAVISLTSTKSGSHVIAVTGDDKSIRVLEHQGNGLLLQLSLRNMPKRPCAIALTADQLTIVCADKFGDVYSVPLLIHEVPTSLEEHMQAEPSSPSDAPKPFISAANHLTIHTARNRRALQNQMKQTQNKEKIEVAFKHDLLLGHVSMLTDLRLAEIDGRNYILTADRDEHVRISRGIPQTHVIEGFCLGHTEFVSRLCLPKTHPNLLISGGGDDELYSWRWLSGELLNRVDLRRHVAAISAEFDSELKENAPGKLATSFKYPRIAVSKICHMEVQHDAPGDFIIVTCEGIPMMFFFSLPAVGDMVHFQTVTLNANPLDIVTTSPGVVTVSLDLIHEAGSTSRFRSEFGGEANALRTFHLQGMGWVEGELNFDIPLQQDLPSMRPKDISLARISSLLYNVENLRKRGGEE